MKQRTYLTIQSWMRTELKLSGNELLVYAIVYGFSQDENSRFTGSRQYIADWCGCTVRRVQSILNDLTDRGLLTKYESTINNVRHCEYVANFTSGEIISPPSEIISLNNIDNNIDSNTISINRNSMQPEDNFKSHSYSPEELRADFLSHSPKTAKVKRKNLYEKCVDEIYSYTQNVALQDVLIKYLSVRLSMKEKPLYGVNQWKCALKKLSNVSGDKVKIVEQTMEHGWCSFYELKSDRKQLIFSENDGVYCESADDTNDERKEQLRRQGRRSEF